MKKRLIVLSIDAMIEEDLKYLQELPHFRRILDDASVVKKMDSTYPTLTHSIHTSILTGCYPGHHGVINNELFMPGVPKAPWYEESSLCKAKTLPEEAKAYGYRTAYIYWPVTLHADVPWVLHRAFIHTPVENAEQNVEERSTPGLYKRLQKVLAPTWKMPHYEGGDMFCALATEALIREDQPDIIYIHMVMIDGLRHANGVYSPKIKQGFEFLDGCVAHILSALDDTGLYDQTIFCITSDHGQIDISRSVSLNRFFADHGLCEIDEKGNLLSWKAYAHSCALSAQVYIKDHDLEVCRQVWELLNENRELLGIGDLLTAEEMRERYHSWGDFDFMVETDGDTAFGYDLTCPLVVKTDNADYRTSVASHGHMPEKGPQPCFIVRNPFTHRHVVLENGRVIDQAPTLARMLDFRMTECDGKPMEELL